MLKPGGWCGDGPGDGSDPGWAEGLRLVGDPVDVITGAETHLETDFRLPGAAVPIMWVRTYDSRQAGVDRGLGFGFRFMFDVELRLDIDGMTFTSGRGVEIAFPFLAQDGQSVMRQAHILERLGPQRYRIHRPKDAPSFELEFGRDLAAGARLTALVGALGHGRTVRFVYDARGLAAMEVGDPGRLVIERDGGHITGIFLVGASVQKTFMARYAYDHRGHLVEVENAYGRIRRFEYDAAGRMARQIDRRGYSFHYTYDDQGRCIHTRGQDGVAEYRFQYRPLERLTIVTRGDGAVWQYFYDEMGSIIQTIDPYGGLTLYPKDDQGRVVKEIDPNRNESEILYDRFGLPFAKRDALGHQRTLPTDPTTHPLSHPLPASPAAWEHGRLARTPPRGPRPSLEVAIPAWVPAAVGTDSEAALKPPATVYDVQGTPLQDVAAGGKVRRWAYDPNGYESWRTDFDGHTTHYEYGSWNHLLRIERPLKRITEIAYTSSEQVAALTDAGGTRSQYRYDLKDRLVEVHRNGRTREKYRYDAADNLLEKLDGDGQSLMKLVIGPGNLVKQRLLASGDQREYVYDNRGRILALRNGAGACTFAYDGRWRTSDERDGLGVRHETSGLRHFGTTVLGCFTTQYPTPEPGVTLVLDPADQTQRLRRIAPGLIERSGSNGVVELAQYDSEGWCVLKAAEGPPLQAGWARRFVYSDDGDLVRRLDSGRGATVFRHDEGHRLARVEHPDGTVDTYVYDAADNLLEAPGLVARMQPGNKLALANHDRFEYNQRDHIARRSGTKGDTRFYYDSRDQLVAVDGPESSYRAEHDGFGRRTKKTVNGQTWRFYWDSDRLAAEIFPDQRVRVYVYPDRVALVPILLIDYDGIDADPVSGKRYHVYCDHLGCPELVLDESGRTVWRARIQPYGTAIVEVGAAFHQPLRWPGHYFDAETGLHENRFRSYSPALGRYLQSDPDGITGGINLYAYTDNPLRSVDLDGLGKVCKDDDPNCDKKNDDGPDHEGTNLSKVSGKDEPSSELQAKMAQAQEKQQHASERAEELPPHQQGKTVASNGGDHLSGYDTAKNGTPPGFESTGRDPKNAVAGDKEIGYESPANSSIDARENRRTGDINGATGKGNTIPGSAAATHSERQAVTTQNENGTNEPMGVSREQCGDCREHHQAHAQDENRPGYPAPVVVGDPAHTRVYNPDGSVDVYGSDGAYKGSSEPGQKPSATRNDYEGVPW